ncbi:thioredoxin family protein [Rhodopirellula baltica]|nr:thioredoxin family protein [Rhodopirellula baltica]
MNLSQVLPLAVASFLMGGSVFADGPSWNREFTSAKAEAKSNGRSLFILFTGHGWCHACEIVDREVFRTEQFVESTEGRYIFLELDFNFGDGPEEEEREKELMQLRSHYLASAVPTVVLADTNGRPYGYITGYEAGSGPDAYLELLSSAENAKKRFDELLKSADGASGKVRAKLLDQALETISPMLGEISDRGDDPLLKFYAPVIDEVLASINEADPTAKKYVALKDRRGSWAEGEAVFERLEEFSAAKDWSGAIGYIDRCLPATTSDSIRWRLESAKQTYLEWDDRNEEALSNSRRLLTEDGITDQYRENFLDRESYNLFRLDRVEEAVEHYDQRIADAGEDQEKRLRLLYWKAQMLHGRDPVSVPVEAWQRYLDEVEHGSDKWLTATVLLAREFQRAGSHEKALPLLEEYLKVESNSWVMLDAAASHLALGNHKRCREYIEQTTELNGKLKDSERQSEQNQFEIVSDRIKKLSQKLGD